ncbi:hypothetical protein FKX85_01095 [Echinicola soli]|uniref:Uncharacterized protein n=1 Tax=Echinicola soli TaxID=2591634 RepID=A0A514CD15_9BACT|nr:hypothetical protein [Echinicola soli]QDH77713.1 hypothetical protein FKX85_01095 [Echinicola soli]
MFWKILLAPNGKQLKTTSGLEFIPLNNFYTLPQFLLYISGIAALTYLPRFVLPGGSGIGTEIPVAAATALTWCIMILATYRYRILHAVNTMFVKELPFLAPYFSLLPLNLPLSPVLLQTSSQ